MYLLFLLFLVFLFCVLFYIYVYQNIKRVYFFDNSSYNFRGLEDITSLMLVKVDDSQNDNIDPIEFQKYISYLSHFSKNIEKYSHILYSHEISNYFDPKSQITIEQIDWFITEIQKGKVRKVVFDWDRTLTKFIDIDIFDTLHMNTRDLALFYFGDRINSFSRMWKELLKNDIEIYILSTNPRANISKYRQLFFDLLKETDLELPSHRLIYISETQKMGKQKKIKELL